MHIHYIYPALLTPPASLTFIDHWPVCTPTQKLYYSSSHYRFTQDDWSLDHKSVYVITHCHRLGFQRSSIQFVTQRWWKSTHCWTFHADKVYDWLTDFFHGHSHCTKFSGLTSEIQEVSAGIIQVRPRSLGNRIRAFDWCQNQRPWVTLNGHYTLFQNTCVFRSPPPCHETLNEDRPTLSATTMYSPMTLDSGSIRFMRIFAGVPWRGCVKPQRGVKTAIFSTFSPYFFRSLRGKANVFIYRQPE